MHGNTKIKFVNQNVDLTETGCTSVDRIQLYDRVAGFWERGNGNGSYCVAKGAKLHGQLND